MLTTSHLVPLYLQVIVAFCWVYIRKYQSRQESEVISTITAICALAIALITSALLPVDIFLVSFMKYPNGTYKVTIFPYMITCTYLCLIQSCSSIIPGVTDKPILHCLNAAWNPIYFLIKVTVHYIIIHCVIIKIENVFCFLNYFFFFSDVNSCAAWKE